MQRLGAFVLRSASSHSSSSSTTAIVTIVIRRIVLTATLHMLPRLDALELL